MSRLRLPEYIGKITRTPGVQGGEPCVAGTRITSASIMGQHRAGKSITGLMADLRLAKADIDAALDFEMERESSRFKAEAEEVEGLSVTTDLDEVIIQYFFSDSTIELTLDEAVWLQEQLGKAIEHLRKKGVEVGA